MNVSYRNFDTGASETSNSFPSPMYTCGRGGLIYYGRQLTLTFETFPGVSLTLNSMYQQCCGMREIGNLLINFHIDAEALRNELMLQLKKSYDYRTIGALTYTRTKTQGGNDLQRVKEVEFIEQWPGASAGDWWYNPNSGNMVQQWTLPVAQHLQLDNNVYIPDDDE